MKLLASLLALSISYALLAQSPTTIRFSLESNDKGRLSIAVLPPAEQKEWKYVIPEIIPGTYMKINYKRFYHRFEAKDNQGNKMKIRKKDNVLLIKGDAPLQELTYEVEQTVGDGKIWDNILACAGNLYTEQSYLLNFQLVSGYFEGFQDQPFRIEVNKPNPLYGATSLTNESDNPERDIFSTTSYDELIDQPVMYAPADTASFRIRDHRFHIAVHAEKGTVHAEMLRPRLTKIMYAIDSFAGFTATRDYHFLFYYVDRSRLKGWFKSFGIGSALEHKSSSVYYFSEPIFDQGFRNLDWIGSHEYFHTITPLNLHSEKIHDFNFKEPDMSRHGWMYEGVTDYFSALLSTQYKLTNSISSNMSWAVRTAEKQKARSFTESSRNIIKKNMFSWIGKIGQLGNFYERGKLVALGLDIEIFERSNGEKRLVDVMLEMKNDLEGKYFRDDQFRKLLVQYTYPELGSFYDRYIAGEEIVPYRSISANLHGITMPKGTNCRAMGHSISGETRSWIITM